MKRINLSVFCILILVLSFSIPAMASDITIKGSALFKCSLIGKYLEKHGYTYIDEVMYDNIYKINRFGAKDAEITIRNKSNEIVGSGTADKNGEFAFVVPEDKGYKIAAKYHGHEVEILTDHYLGHKYTADLGRYSSKEVGGWIKSLPVTYCYNCDIRYLEAKGAM